MRKMRKPALEPATKSIPPKTVRARNCKKPVRNVYNPYLLQPAHQRNQLPERSVLVLFGDQGPGVLFARVQGGPLRPDGEEAQVLRPLHRRLPAAEEDEAREGAGRRAGPPDRRLCDHVRPRGPGRVERRPRRDQVVHQG